MSFPHSCIAETWGGFDAGYWQGDAEIFNTILELGEQWLENDEAQPGVATQPASTADLVSVCITLSRGYAESYAAGAQPVAHAETLTMFGSSTHIHFST